MKVHILELFIIAVLALFLFAGVAWAVAPQAATVRIYFDGTSAPVRLPPSVLAYVGDPCAVPSVYVISDWLRLVTYGPYHFAVFNDRGVFRVIAIVNYNFRPPRCWKHGAVKGELALERISELKYLKLLAEYHGK